jgi:hypothetical protein
MAKGKTKKDKENNFADVVIRLIDALYDLAQTGNLIGLIIFGFIGWGFLVTYKLPPEILGEFLGRIGEFLTSEKFYFFPLLSALATSVFTNVMQARVYKSHIHDLTEHRKNLVHGFQSGELKTLKNHTSSGFDVRTGSINNRSGNKNDNI